MTTQQITTDLTPLMTRAGFVLLALDAAEQSADCGYCATSEAVARRCMRAAMA